MQTDETSRTVLKVMETVLELELRAVRQALGEEDVPAVRPRRQGSRRHSIVTQCVQILAEARRPLHVNRIVDLLREKFGRVTDRDSVASALAKRARRGLLINQTAPATFTRRREEHS